jgi:hypothetical protein
MNALALRTYDFNRALAERLRGICAKIIARKAGASPRTAENWKAAESSPTWKHVAIMLQDDELCRALLEAAGRADLADAHVMLTKLRAAKRALEGIDV